MSTEALLERSVPAARRAPAPLMNPYLAGAGIGVVLLAAFVIMGRGLGATGAFSSVLAWALALVSPDYVATNPIHSGYWNDGQPLAAFLVFLALGVFAGGLVSGLLARRAELTVERGPRMASGPRLGLAALGGMLTAFGAKLALGCTSGQALTGGALLNVGSWTFMIAVFIGGYALAPLLRRQWR